MSVSNAAHSPEPQRRAEAADALPFPDALLFHPDLSDVDIRLYGVLAWHLHRGVPAPARKQLAGVLGKSSPRSIDSALARLEAAGYVTVIPQRGEGGQALANRYEVHREPSTDQARGRLNGGRLCPAVSAQTPSAAHRRLHQLADRQSGWLCAYCGIGLIDVCDDTDMIIDSYGNRMISPYSGKRLPVRDHRVPKALNGSSSAANLVLACGPCNLKKGAQ